MGGSALGVGDGGREGGILCDVFALSYDVIWGCCCGSGALLTKEEDGMKREVGYVHTIQYKNPNESPDGMKVLQKKAEHQVCAKRESCLDSGDARWWRRENVRIGCRLTFLSNM